MSNGDDNNENPQRPQPANPQEAADQYGEMAEERDAKIKKELQEKKEKTLSHKFKTKVVAPVSQFAKNFYQSTISPLLPKKEQEIAHTEDTEKLLAELNKMIEQEFPITKAKEIDFAIPEEIETTLREDFENMAELIQHGIQNLRRLTTTLTFIRNYSKDDETIKKISEEGETLLEIYNTLKESLLISNSDKSLAQEMIEKTYKIIKRSPAFKDSQKLLLSSHGGSYEKLNRTEQDVTNKVNSLMNNREIQNPELKKVVEERLIIAGMHRFLATQFLQNQGAERTNEKTKKQYEVNALNHLDTSSLELLYATAKILEKLLKETSTQIPRTEKEAKVYMQGLLRIITIDILKEKIETVKQIVEKKYKK